MALLKCILHLPDTGSTEEEVQPFTEEKWAKVKTAASRRQSRPQSSKYSVICDSLQETACDNDGYHYTCYCKFTAVPVNKDTSPTSEPQSFLRSQTTQLKTSSSGVLPNICIFCNKSRKKLKGKELVLTSCLYDSVEDNIKEAARLLNDSEMLVKIGDIGFHSKEVKYHNECKRDYLNRTRDVSTKTNTVRPQLEQLNADALKSIFLYIECSVIDNNRPEYLVSLHHHYCKFLERESAGKDLDIVFHKVETLGDKIVHHFGDRVVLDCSSRKEGLVVFSSKTSREFALAMASNCNTTEEFTVMEAASMLRATILETSKCTPELPASLSLEDFKKGQVETPYILNSFFTTLLSGSQKRKDVSEEVKRRAESLSQDVLYCVSRGRVKPSKHLCLGVGMKSLTGSRRVVEVLNRLGHSIGYHVAESIETEIASNITEKGRLLPDLLLQQVGLSTGLAWDNYDELTETLSGKGTLHDTVGICYQNRATVEQATAMEQGSSEDAYQQEKPPKRRRQYEAPERHIIPYKRKSSMSKFSYEIYTEDPPTSLKRAMKMNMIWLICCHIQNHTPMWRGWNSLVLNDSLPLQAIGYMENIELPPTRLDVVRETLARSQKVASECGEKYAIVAYDLAIAKPALQMQAQESPQFDNVFICFGTFHIYMAYFGSLGYILESSGGPEILCNADVLASGSMRGFIGGKHFNRCKRIHPLFALALQILHFKQFIEIQGALSDECMATLNVFAGSPAPDSLSTLLDSDVIANLLERYGQFCDMTRRGEHGVTARFWILYIDLVHIYLLLDRACRTNDVALYTYALRIMCPIFFATHRPNYARWMSLYHLNLLNMDSTHPGIRNLFEKGALSVRRTNNSFSRSAVDLTLEQTVNRDAASRHGGIAAFTQNVNARKRWTVTRSFRGAIVSCLLDMAGLTLTEDTARELKPSRIEKDNTDLGRIITELENTLNPFTVHTESLYCLSTGKAASESVKEDLIHTQDKGSQWHQEFISDCKANAGRFEQAIKRRKVKNFAHDAVKVKVTAKDKQIREVRCTRDLFGRLLFLAVTQNVDLGTVLSYPLTPVPFSLCHITGDMNKTSKSTLMDKLEAMGSRNDAPTKVDVFLIDAMFFLRTLNLPSTFGGVAMSILKQACSNAADVHVVCDTYPDGPSIKDCEHELRGHSQASYKITGPSQKRPTDFHTALLSPTFKKELLAFLKEEWTSQAYASSLKGHRLYYATEQDCFLYTADDGNVKRRQIHELQSGHEEADTRLIFHANFIAQISDDPTQVIVIRSNDTDVFILLLYHAQHINATLWMDAGVNSKNTRRMINITDLATKLTPPICAALPSVHAFTGCDYTASFMRKAKWRPFEIMKKSELFTSAMSQLGCSDIVDLDVAATIEEYVCVMYGVRNLNDVNEARLHLFRKLYAPKKQTDPLENIKSSDACCLPPCRAVLQQKLRRTNYVAYVWRNARQANPSEFGPDGHGWKIERDRLIIMWYEGPRAPTNIIVQDSDFDDDVGEEEDEIQEYSVSSDEDEESDQE